MDASHATIPRRRVPRLFSGFSILLVLMNLLILVPEWGLWRSGAADVYPGQHRNLVFGSLSGILLALALPIPVLLGYRPEMPQGRRRTLYVLVTALLVGSVAMQWGHIGR